MEKTKTQKRNQAEAFPLPYQGGQKSMTLSQMSQEYRNHAQTLGSRVKELDSQRKLESNLKNRHHIEERMRILSTMEREARELAVLTERYYERGYRRNAKYTL